MRWLSVLSELPDTQKAVAECAAKVRESGLGPPDLVFLFPSPHHAERYEELPKLLLRQMDARHLLGCSGGGIIAGGREIERKSGLGLVCAWLPGVELALFHLAQEGMPDPDARPKAWRDWLGAPAGAESLVLLADPFSLQAEELVRGLDFAYPRAVKVGGLASGASQPGGNALFIDGKAVRRGAVGAALTGNIAVDPIVAQGCRPIGKPLRITRGEKNVIFELEGRTALETVQALFAELPPADQELARNSLFVGILGDPFKSGEEGDYLIRNLVGIDPKQGCLAVGAFVRAGQIMRFHLRDGRASAQDLEAHLAEYSRRDSPTKPAGALLFSCLGRGRHLYRRDNHDIELFRSKMGPLAVGGFFCNGEIGPVAGSTYLHGYTSCFGIFREKETAQ